MAQEPIPVNGQPVRVVRRHGYFPRPLPPLPPAHALHGDGPHYDRSELTDMGLPAAQVNALLRDRDTVAAGELDYLLHSLDGGAQ
jgi:hypothetical protein